MHRMLIVALVATLLVAAPAPAAMTEARPDRKSDVMLYVVAPKLAGRAHVETRIGTGQDWSDECEVGTDCGPSLPTPTFLMLGAWDVYDEDGNSSPFDTVDIEWLVDDVVVASGPATYIDTNQGWQVDTYTPPLDSLGKTLVVRATGHDHRVDGPVVRTSAPRTIEKGVLWCNAVRMKGERGYRTVKAGRRLTVVPGEWVIRTRLTYRWTLGRKVVRDNPRRAFTPTAAMVGKSLSVAAVGHRRGFKDLACAVPSAPFRVVR